MPNPNHTKRLITELGGGGGLDEAAVEALIAAAGHHEPTLRTITLPEAWARKANDATSAPVSANGFNLARTAANEGAGWTVFNSQDYNNTSGGGKVQFQYTMPATYPAAGAVAVTFAAAVTAAFTVSAAADCQAYIANAGSDLVTTAAQSCNSTSYADFTFVLTTTNLAPGTLLTFFPGFVLDDTGGSTNKQGLLRNVRLTHIM